MILRLSSLAAGLLAVLATSAPLAAQTSLGQEAQAEAPKSLVLYFGPGSAAIRPNDTALLDQAARLYRDGRPIIMMLTGGTDAVGSPEAKPPHGRRRARLPCCMAWCPAASRPSGSNCWPRASPSRRSRRRRAWRRRRTAGWRSGGARGSGKGRGGAGPGACLGLARRRGACGPARHPPGHGGRRGRLGGL